MSAIRRTTIAGAVKFLSTIGERQIRVIASDATPDRMGDILIPAGCQLDRYRENPIVLAQHDSAAPIARCSQIGLEGNAIVATIEFPAAGISERSDEYCALAKAGILGAVSVGFLPIQSDPIREGGWKFTAWELLELSIVSVPANPSALVIERSATARTRRRAAPDVEPEILIGGKTIAGARALLKARRIIAEIKARRPDETHIEHKARLRRMAWRKFEAQRRDDGLRVRGVSETEIARRRAARS